MSVPGIPWHRRVPGAARVRDIIRSRFFATLRSAFETDDGRTIASHALRGLLTWRPDLRAEPVDPPYPELGRATAERLNGRPRPVIITARFRSGSTLLWNLFRHVKTCTAYYEPLNERRWFDPATRGSAVDRTHRGVEDYWHEYDGLESLGDIYRGEWIDRNLYMDASFWDPGLREYVTRLIEAAPHRAVLQFNRIDFRLAWFRHAFPTAYFVHLYRHPRDQWCSALLDPRSVPRDLYIDAFGPHDHFYLRSWARDLKYHFPFLDERVEPHPYRLFYYIWKISYLFGRAYADLSIQYETLLQSPEEQIRRLMTAIEMEPYDLAALAELVEPQPVRRWQPYASDEWFEGHEAICEAVLKDFLRPSR